MLMDHLRLTIIISKTLFASLGFKLLSNEGEQLLDPPSLESTPAGRRDRSKLLRAWVEMGAWLADFKRRNSKIQLS